MARPVCISMPSAPRHSGRAFGLGHMNTMDFILSAGPLLIWSLFCLVICIRSIRSCPFDAWQLVTLIAIGVVNLLLVLWISIGPMRYLLAAILVLWVGTNAAGLLWLKRKKKV